MNNNTNDNMYIIEMLKTLKECVSPTKSSGILMITTLQGIKPYSFEFVIDKAIEALKEE